MTSRERIRAKLWADVLTAVAARTDCTKIGTAEQWADGALKAFDRRFMSKIKAKAKIHHLLHTIRAESVEKEKEEPWYKGKVP